METLMYAISCQIIYEYCFLEFKFSWRHIRVCVHRLYRIHLVNIFIVALLVFCFFFFFYVSHATLSVL